MSDVVRRYAESAVADFSDLSDGPGYRCSVDLKDGSHLPCVIIKHAAPVDLAVRRFKEGKTDQSQFSDSKQELRSVLSMVTAVNNGLNPSDVASVGHSKFALPVELLNQIEGETAMGWTGWVFEMNDGKLFSFGTTFSFAFFELPDGFEFHDVSKIHNHSYLSKQGKLITKGDGNGHLKPGRFYEDLPYLECFI